MTHPNHEADADADRCDLLVVGGGLAGLAAATIAARAGQRVTLLDGRALGGRARTTVKDGFSFNQGAHALYRDGAGSRVLRALGIVPAGAQPPTKGAMGMRVLETGGERRVELGLLPGSPGTLATTRLFSARGKMQIARLLGRVQKWDASAVADVSVTHWLDTLAVDAEVRTLIETIARLTTYVGNLDRLSADTAVRQIQLGLGKGGVLYLDRGWQQLVDALVLAATNAGAAIVAGAPLRTLDRDDHGYVAHTRDRSIRARSVILAVGGPAAVKAALPGSVDFGELGPEATAAALDLGLARPPRLRTVLGLGAPTYLSMHSPPADLAPPGHSVVQVMRYTARSSEEDRAQLWDVAAHAGIRDEDVVVDRFQHRLVVTTSIPTPERGGLAGRPDVVVDGMPGVFIAGDWVGAEGMLADATLSSAERAANAAVRHLEQSMRVTMSA